VIQTVSPRGRIDASSSSCHPTGPAETGSVGTLGSPDPSGAGARISFGCVWAQADINPTAATSASIAKRGFPVNNPCILAGS
jgi:hypothetical protein